MIWKEIYLKQEKKLKKLARENQLKIFIFAPSVQDQ